MCKLFTLLPIVCLLFAFTLQAQVYELERPYKNHLEMKNLKGRLKEVKEYRYGLINQKTDSPGTQGPLEMYFITTYNTKGNKISYRHFRADHSLARIEEYEYDAKGRMITAKSSDSDTQKFGSVIAYTYDPKGRLVAELYKMISSGNVIYKKTYQYDDKDRLVNAEGFFPSNKDSHTSLINYTGTTESVQTTYKRSFETTKTVRQYDTRLRLLRKESHTYPKAPSANSIYEYDKFGNIIELKRFKADEKTPHIQEFLSYIYDDNHNWTNRVTNFKSTYQNQSVTRRELSYY